MIRNDVSSSAAGIPRRKGDERTSVPFKVYFPSAGNYEALKAQWSVTGRRVLDVIKISVGQLSETS